MSGLAIINNLIISFSCKQLHPYIHQHKFTNCTFLMDS